MSQYNYRHIKIKGLSAAVPAQNKKPDSSVSDVKNIRIALPEQTASDLGFAAAKQLLDKHQINKEEIACIIFASITPDYRSPATAAVLQYRLGIPVDCIAYDLVLGATGFISGIQKAASVLESTNKQYALVIAADTNSKLMDINNPAAYYLGDGGSALLLEKAVEAETIQLSFFTLSDQWESMIHKAGGFRVAKELINDGDRLHANKAIVSQMELHQDEFEAAFQNQAVKSLEAFLRANELTLNQFDKVLLQPLSSNSLSSVAAQLNLPADDMIGVSEQYGNTSASAIPLYLAVNKGKNKSGDSKILGLSFGEGLSLAIASFTISSDAILPLIVTDDVFAEGSVSHTF